MLTDEKFKVRLTCGSQSDNHQHDVVYCIPPFFQWVVIQKANDGHVHENQRSPRVMELSNVVRLRVVEFTEVDAAGLLTPPSLRLQIDCMLVIPH